MCDSFENKFTGGGRLMAHPPTPCLWGRGAGLRFRATGAFAEPTDKLAHRLQIHYLHFAELCMWHNMLYTSLMCVCMCMHVYIYIHTYIGSSIHICSMAFYGQLFLNPLCPTYSSDVVRVSKLLFPT